MTTYDERIHIPNNPVELMDLGMKVYAIHCVMGIKSPLISLTIELVESKWTGS